MRRLSIAAVALAVPLGACVPQEEALNWTPIARPAPDDPAPLVCAIAIVLPIKSVSAIVAINFALSILSPMTDHAFSWWRCRNQSETHFVLINARHQ